jgi:uncharacterized protein YaeQ
MLRDREIALYCWINAGVPPEFRLEWCDTKSHQMSGRWRVTTAPTSAQVGS